MRYPIRIVVESLIAEVSLLEFIIGVDDGTFVVSVFDDVQPSQDFHLNLTQEEFDGYGNEKERLFGILIKKNSTDYIIGSCDLCGCSIDSAFQEIEVSDLGFYKKLKEIIDAKIIH